MENNSEQKLRKTTFKVKNMDCPSEENIIRMKLAELGAAVSAIDFDLRHRTLVVTHQLSALDALKATMDGLSLGASMISTADADEAPVIDSDESQHKVLVRVLVVNALFFLFEMAVGLVSRSMGLVADSLDMLADASVYGMSLMVVGAAVASKKRVALWSGILQTLLAVVGLAEVVHRFLSPEVLPEFSAMIWMSALALLANTYCLWQLERSKSNDAHIRTSVIFSANDVIINLGVILSGVAVWYFKSRLPDLIIGSIVFAIVIRGAVHILKLSK